MSWMLVNTILDEDDIPSAKLDEESDEQWVMRNMSACKEFLRYSTENSPPQECRVIDKAPRDGVMVYFATGDGITEMIVHSDPPSKTTKEVLAIMMDHCFLLKKSYIRV